MKFPIYSERDLKVGFGFPYVSQSDAYAVRDFQRRLQSDGPMGFSPQDFQLFKIGEYNTDTAEIVTCTPVLLYDGGEARVGS